MSQILLPEGQPLPSFLMMPGQHKLFEQACAYMLEHIDEKIYLESVCHAVGSNRNKLTALFRTRCGHGAMHWLQNQRLKKAKELLRYTDISVAGIALDTGFSDATNFCHAFKKKYNISPGKYRRNIADHDDK